MHPIINTMLDPVVNFGKVTVSTGYSNVDTVTVLSTGNGSKLPNPSTDGPFNLVWFDSSTYGDASDDPNVEIVRCTARDGDVLTVIRAQEGTSASNKNTPTKIYEMILSPTKKTITDIKAEYESGISTHSSLDTGVHGVGVSIVESIAGSQAKVNTHADLTTAHGVTGTIVGTTDSQNLTNKVIYDSSNYVISDGLRHSTGWVNTKPYIAPTPGQVLTAINSTEANWQSIGAISGARMRRTFPAGSGAWTDEAYLDDENIATPMVSYITNVVYVPGAILTNSQTFDLGSLKHVELYSYIRLTDGGWGSGLVIELSVDGSTYYTSTTQTGQLNDIWTYLNVFGLARYIRYRHWMNSGTNAWGYARVYEASLIY